MYTFEEIITNAYTDGEWVETEESAVRDFRADFAREFKSVEPRVTLRDRVRITLTGHL
jgi:hypothetical protein